MEKTPPRGFRLTTASGQAPLIRKPAAGSLAWQAAVLSVLLLGRAVYASDQPQELPVIGLNAGIHLIQAQVATTEQQRLLGLMYRQAMAANEGMLFVFDKQQQQCLWMKNTLLPLSAAFLAEDGSIVNIEEMQPESLEIHCSTKPVRFVLEMTRGWFSKRGITAGTRIQGGPFGDSTGPGANPRQVLRAR